MRLHAACSGGHVSPPRATRRERERGLPRTSASDGNCARADRAQRRRRRGQRRRPAAAVLHAAGVVADEQLHRAVFQRMETDHRQPAARLEPLQRGMQAVLQRIQFAVHADAQRLEAARGRMLARLAATDACARSMRPAAPVRVKAWPRDRATIARAMRRLCAPRRSSTARRRSRARRHAPGNPPRFRPGWCPCACPTARRP